MEKITFRLATIASLVMLGVFSSSIGLGAGKDLSEGAVIHVEDGPRYLGWDDGTLAVKLKSPTGKLKQIELKFDGEHKKNLQRVSIVTTDWSADITDSVAPLPFPFINRTTIVVPRWTRDGDISDVYFTMPYSKDGKASSCMVFEIAISLGKVVMKDQSSAPVDRCAP
jgi:hypothetical protein